MVMGAAAHAGLCDEGGTITASMTLFNMAELRDMPFRRADA